MLRHYVGEIDHTEWDTFLLKAEFAINNSYHESFGTTPFRLNNGRDPRLQLTLRLPSTSGTIFCGGHLYAPHFSEGPDFKLHLISHRPKFSRPAARDISFIGVLRSGHVLQRRFCEVAETVTRMGFCPISLVCVPDKAPCEQLAIS